MADSTQVDEPSPTLAAAGSRMSIGDLLSRLIEELRDWFTAELALYRAEATRRSLSAGVAAGLILAAITLAQGALIAALVGIILMLTPETGVGLATLIVVAGAILVGAALAWLGVRRITRVIDPDQPS